MKNLSKIVRDFSNKRDWEQYHTPKNLAMALSVEVAELVEHFQWLTQEQSNNLSKHEIEAVKEEIGDIMIYLVNLADKLEIDPLAAAYAKVEKNEKKYPVDKVRGR